ncbi:MAG TPA: PEP-CTERM sorting domain-containing protein [Chthoniobacterales bacterium]|nr:PEP-CTERM sorting domain-containing protein [Chthoniobacterales bacterium]
MLKGILLALAVAWLAVVQPNLPGNPTANTNPLSITSANGPKLSVDAAATQVPEPSTVISLIFGVGLLGGVLLRIRSR